MEISLNKHVVCLKSTKLEVWKNERERERERVGGGGGGG